MKFLFEAETIWCIFFPEFGRHINLTRQPNYQTNQYTNLLHPSFISTIPLRMRKVIAPCIVLFTRKHWEGKNESAYAMVNCRVQKAECRQICSLKEER